VLDFSALTGWRSASAGVKAAELQRSSSRNDIVFDVRSNFVAVLQAIKVAQVNTEALRLARDNERRVRALFEVGSVSRSDVLRAQVSTAQSELDSLVSVRSVTVQRIALATTMGIRESEMGEVDTVITVTPQEYDEAAVVTEAAKARPDLRAAEAALTSAQLGLRSAHFAWLPYVAVTGSAAWNPASSSSFTFPPVDSNGVEIAGPRLAQDSRRSTDRSLGASVSVNWNFFDGFATKSRISSARANLMRAQETRDALQRNLESEVHQVLLTYNQALAGDEVARRAVESAEENVKLTQQKYNVGSSTILDLIDAQVSLQRARSDLVAARAAILVAQAQIDRVRGRGE
jgi:outer membrane protein TolC